MSEPKMSEPKKLESLTIEECWQLYCSHNPPPPGTDPQEIAFVRQVYMAGFGAMLMIVKRLETESPERSKSIIDRLEADLWSEARALNPASVPS